jgi:citrate/tricarballylate utilization protein
LAVLASLFVGMIVFWRGIGGELKELLDLKAHLKAAGEVLQLKYLDGGGYGCNYPDERFSMIRRWFHHCVFYGFFLCFASTTIAAIYHHFLHWNAPYLFLSWPVILGSVGGVAILVGTGGLFYLKQRMDTAPAVERAYSMDVGFLALLFFTTLTGFLVLLFRETSAMGTMLIFHLGLVLALFVSLPFSKFVHAGYRYLGLVRNAIEAARERE